MKKIEAIIRPEKLEPLKTALLQREFNGLTINQVLGCGKQMGFTESIQGNTIMLNTLSKVEIRIVVPDERLAEIIETITSVAETGEYGDGKIFISDVLDCIRIRTKEHGDKAL
ncbi:P-II family nitrogen regulator [Anaeromicropila populeti]|uniref:Nitrogen regulatory protein P-II family n=1 Tax=Anaeromicropila populeti TaxID=37658 RepID=A0A1I6JYK2_9FIRM|nr:P-II family nitrogen regulator [Anaeromicropila populeti]SFR83978.1 nitrogen regulatory protein P-II family [Anaeromicropila populeti]